MRLRKKHLSQEERDKFVAEVRREQAERQQGYREQALKILPHICGRCGRAFSGRELQKLTVHHMDHNHMNNPPDGSNWELLCEYCHDDEHQTRRKGGYFDGYAEDEPRGQSLGFQPFGGLANLLNRDGKEPDTKDGEGK